MDKGEKEEEEEEEEEGRERSMKRAESTTQKSHKGTRDREKEGATRRERVGIVLTLISLRMTSIMLPITMRKSNTFHGSLKYPYTG